MWLLAASGFTKSLLNNTTRNVIMHVTHNARIMQFRRFFVTWSEYFIFSKMSNNLSTFKRTIAKRKWQIKDNWSAVSMKLSKSKYIIIIFPWKYEGSSEAQRVHSSLATTDAVPWLFVFSVESKQTKSQWDNKEGSLIHKLYEQQNLSHLGPFCV